jgi:ferric-dicitrate binding protein FerR (iron transport regulator)
MGQHANARAWAEFERLDRQRQDQSFEDEPQQTEAERAAEWDRQYWDRIVAEARLMGVGEWK